nr:hypothetical protein [Lentisphaerota bacterium]
MNKLIETSDCINNLLLALRRNYFPTALFNASKDIHKYQNKFLSIDNLHLVQLNKIRFRERKDIRYAMTSLFAALHGTMEPLVFILTGDCEKTSVYLGFWSKQKRSDDLYAAIKGFIPGTEFTAVENSSSVVDFLKTLPKMHGIMGVPSEKQAFQEEKRTTPVEFGIERLADSMTRDNYGIMITATPVNLQDTAQYFENLSGLLDYTHRLAKTSEQCSFGTQQGYTYQHGENIGKNKQEGSQETSSVGYTDAPWLLKRWKKGGAKFFSGGV